ncbi:MAG: class I SAM-dependent methyltransferase [Gammaproteobacteria bacterium]|nr:class I SAM-dependent methyltransferase [Gammaproteobacteria bacterium]
MAFLRTVLCTLTLIAVVGFAQADVGTFLEQAITGEHRAAAHKARDSQRHPKETLMFFGLEPQMQVIEMLPGAEAWYTEILAPVLREQGRLVTVMLPPDAPPPYARKQYELFNAKLDAAPALYDRIERRTMPRDPLVLGPAGSADMVLTFRNTHGWIRAGQFDDVYKAIFEVLKSGGILGIEQHRAPDDWDADAKAKTGYVPEKFMIEQLELIGFKLEGKSEINANPKDTKDYPDGVWTLPPSYALGDKDRAKYEAIGESDRMTLKFRKP